MKDFLAGCGFLSISLVIIVVVAVVIGTQCGGDDESQLHRATPVPGTEATSLADPTATRRPTPTPFPLVNASDVYYEYQANETRANSLYKGRWLRVQLTRIDWIDDGGKVLMSMDSYGWNQIQMDFERDRDVILLNPGESITAICKVSGFEWDSLLVFKDCRFP